MGGGWDLIKDIQKRDLSRRFAKPKLKHLRHIAIDEIAIAKGHRYLTIVLDLQDDEAAGVRLQRPRILQAQDPGDP